MLKHQHLECSSFSFSRCSQPKFSPKKTVRPALFWGPYLLISSHNTWIPIDFSILLSALEWWFPGFKLFTSRYAFPTWCCYSGVFFPKVKQLPLKELDFYILSIHPWVWRILSPLSLWHAAKHFQVMPRFLAALSASTALWKMIRTSGSQQDYDGLATFSTCSVCLSSELLYILPLKTSNTMLRSAFDRAKRKEHKLKKSKSFIRQRAQPSNKNIAVLM